MDILKTSPFLFGGTNLVLLFIAFVAIWRARRLKTYKREIKFPSSESDTIWDISIILYMGLITCMGGAISSIVGVTSFWLYYGVMESRGKTRVEAQVTSIYLDLLGSFTTSVQYFSRGITKIDYLEMMVFL